MSDAAARGHDYLCGERVLVAGYGVAGRSAVRALLDRHAIVLLANDGPVELEPAVSDDVDLYLVGSAETLPEHEDEPGVTEVDVVVASPGYRPSHPLLRDAIARGVPVWGELELAWQLRGGDADAGPIHVAPWLALTGTNGKTTTVHMLESILRTAGLNAVAVGNVGVPIIDAVRDPEIDVLAVEVSSQQLHFAPSVRPAAGAVLNLAPDHLDWHGSFEAYAQAKFRLWNAEVAIGNLDDPLVAAAMPAGAVGFSLGEPAEGQFGVLDGRLVSRAFGDDHAVLAAVDEIRPAGRHNVANALAAAALAGRTASGRTRSPTGCAASSPTRTATSPSSSTVACVGSTTARPPTRTRRQRRWRPTGASCGSPAGSSRASRSTTSSRRPRPGWPARCCSARIAPWWRRHSCDTRRRSR